MSSLPRHTDITLVVAWMSRCGAVGLPYVTYTVAAHVMRRGTAVVRVSAEGTTRCPAGTHAAIVRLERGSPNTVTTVGNDFLSRCASLTSADFSGLSAVTTVGGYFLLGCTSLFAGSVSHVPRVIRGQLPSHLR